MLTRALQTKWIMQLMLLIYLLLSFGIANSTFWCQEDENSSHLEVNPIGKCWVNCSPETELLQQSLKISQSTGLSFLLGDDCLDSPVVTSALSSSKSTDLLTKNLSSSFDTTYLPNTPGLSLGITHLTNHTHLPEFQGLQVLRTIILLR